MERGRRDGARGVTDVRARARALVARMTLEEKAALCSGRDMWSTEPIDRLGIPSIFLTDGPHGVRRGLDGSIGDVTRSAPATCFPTAPGLAATWNVALLEEIGAALGREAQAHGVQVLLGPGVNMKRSPLGGRNFEYFSEDPVLAGRLAAAWIRGVQSQGVGASLKHFAANNQEWERLVGNSIVDERTLHEIYLPAFETAVKEAQPWTVMCAYNKLNGTYASENPLLLDTILRRAWGFEGIVVSDWGAVNDRVAGVRAGLHLEMPGSGGVNDRKIMAAVAAGELPVATLDALVADTLALVLRASEQARPRSSFDADAHHALARRAAGESAVLLKNDWILPLDLDRPGRIAVIGAFARHPRYQGSGSSRVSPTKLVGAFDELVALAGAADVTYAAGYDAWGATSDALLAEARDAAKAADRAIVFVGLPDPLESEGFDRERLDLPPGHDRLVETVATVQPDTAVVLMNGAPVAMPWLGRVKAVLEAYLGGQAGGGALADVLTGRVNPSGKLAETFPVRLRDTPAHPNFPGRNREVLYGEGLFIGYRHYDEKGIEPLFPFGFGLSYTTFAYTSIEADASAFDAAAGTKLHVTVRNTGARAGAEVVQLYVHPIDAPVLRPEQELKHFAKVSLAAGAEETLTFELTARDFACYDPRVHDWVVDPGAFEVRVGGSSRDLPLRQVLRVEGAARPLPELTRDCSLADLEAHPRGKPIYDQVIQGMLAEAPSPASGEPRTPEERAAAEHARETVTRFVREQPLGRLVTLSQGRLSEEMLAGILAAVNE